MSNRKKLASCLRDYETMLRVYEENIRVCDVLSQNAAKEAARLVVSNIRAIKRFAMDISVLTSEECYGMTTRELVEKIEAEPD